MPITVHCIHTIKMCKYKPLMIFALKIMEKVLLDGQSEGELIARASVTCVLKKLLVYLKGQGFATIDAIFLVFLQTARVAFSDKTFIRSFVKHVQTNLQLAAPQYVAPRVGVIHRYIMVALSRL